jgi:hypothetical protein
MAKPIINYRLTDHAKDEMARRQISEDDVAKVLAAPDQTETVREGREVYQSSCFWRTANRLSSPSICGY